MFIIVNQSPPPLIEYISSGWWSTERRQQDIEEESVLTSIRSVIPFPGVGISTEMAEHIYIKVQAHNVSSRQLSLHLRCEASF